MSEDYSKISDTAQLAPKKILPKISAYIARMAPQIAAMGANEPFIIADYGAADGANSSKPFGQIISQLRAINPLLKIRLVYIDLAEPERFEKFWAASKLSSLENVEAQYIRRSFYEPLPELAGRLRIGFSSTALHWLNAKTADADFFKHPDCIQPCQLPDAERRKFAQKWKEDFSLFLENCSLALAGGGALFAANLTDLGGCNWPASAAYNNLRDICRELYNEKLLSLEEITAVFVPSYFATPDEFNSLLEKDRLKQLFTLNSLDILTAPCAYSAKMQNKLNAPEQKAELADTLSRVVRAWSESSIRVGLSPAHKDMADEIYKRLREKFYAKPQALPYQYCLLELTRN